MSLDIWLKFQFDTGGPEPVEVTLYSGNYTGNVIPMWRQAGVLEALYDNAGELASSIVPALEMGLAHMKANADLYKPLNPSNGWGTYEGAMKFLSELLEACKMHPKATIGVWA